MTSARTRKREETAPLPASADENHPAKVKTQAATSGLTIAVVAIDMVALTSVPIGRFLLAESVQARLNREKISIWISRRDAGLKFDAGRDVRRVVASRGSEANAVAASEKRLPARVRRHSAGRRRTLSAVLRGESRKHLGGLNRRRDCQNQPQFARRIPSGESGPLRELGLVNRASRKMRASR